jgi:hypothetical protein
VTVADLARLPALAGWDAAEVLEATPATAEELIRARLEVGVLAAIDGIIALAQFAREERTRLAACREVLDLAQHFGTVQGDPGGLVSLVRAIERHAPEGE